METYTVFPDQTLTPTGPIGRIFTGLGIGTFHEACRWVHQLPYGYNSDRDDLKILFKEKRAAAPPSMRSSPHWPPSWLCLSERTWGSTP